MRTSEEQAQMALDLWELFKEFVPSKQRGEIAENFLTKLDNHGVYADEIVDFIKGEDTHLDRAFSLMIEEEDDEDYEEED